MFPFVLPYMVFFYRSWRDTRTRHTDISVKLGFCHPFCPCKAPDSVQESAQEDLDRGEVVWGDSASYWIYYNLDLDMEEVLWGDKIA